MPFDVESRVAGPLGSADKPASGDGVDLERQPVITLVGHPRIRVREPDPTCSFDESAADQHAHGPTLVLLDMRMPFVDGWAVARSMRESGSKVPIIVMTAAESSERWADEIGAAGHLAKPFGLDELISCIEEHMGRDLPN